MADLIERDAVIWITAETGALETQQRVKELPAVNRWIPCGDKLPESYEDVLVWFEYFRYGEYNCMYSTYGIGNYSEQYNSWLIDRSTGWKNLRVLAWMPLPEPPENEVQNG